MQTVQTTHVQDLVVAASLPQLPAIDCTSPRTKVLTRYYSTCHVLSCTSFNGYPQTSSLLGALMKSRIKDGRITRPVSSNPDNRLHGPICGRGLRARITQQALHEPDIESISEV